MSTSFQVNIKNGVIINGSRRYSCFVNANTHKEAKAKVEAAGYKVGSVHRLDRQYNFTKVTF